MSDQSVRQAARVVLVDPTGAVLLLSGRDQSCPGDPGFWFVPGGGVKEGEAIEDAARRELYEEVGASLGDLGPVAWQRHTSFTFDGCWYDQDESFFVVRTQSFVARATALTQMEQRAVTGARWWPLAELASTAEVVYPPELATLVQAWTASGPPASPPAIK
jgi:8-oxo-dGTP pyrophosphatase MutT (NUDIX family)